MFVAYRQGVFKFLAVLFVLAMLGGGVGLVLKGKGAISAFGDQLTNPQDPEDTTSKPLPKRKVCASLGAAKRRALVGVATPVKVTEIEGTLSPYTCRWTSRDFSATTTFVDIAAVPADTWAVEASKRLLQDSIGAERASQLMAMLDKDVTPEEGCRFAQAYFAAKGSPTSAVRMVARTTSFGSIPAMKAESCVDGRYYSVVASARKLRLGGGLDVRVANALRTVETKLG